MPRKPKAPKSDTIKLDDLSETHADEIESIRGEINNVVYDVSDFITSLQSCESLVDFLHNLSEAHSTIEAALSELEDLKSRAESVQEEIDNPDDED